MNLTGTFKVGVFDSEEKMISSIKALQKNGMDIYEVYTPYPVHEVLHLMKRKSKLPTAAYIYGLTGALAVLAFLYYTSVISWPIVYGGKPFNSFPSFIVITIILTIFTVTIASLATFSARSKLYPGQNNPIFHERATDDMFVIVVKEDPKASEVENIFRAEGASEISNKVLSVDTK